MVENSLGRLWLEGHPSNKDKFLPTKKEQNKYIETHEDDGKWHYYLEEAEQEPEVQKQLDEIHKEYSTLKPEDILCIDPCQGSGHILCYLFDTLIKIYEDYGYSARDAASKIVENNIWGLDIDERASQLAYFSIMMKARQYDRRFFTRHVQPHIYAIQESNHIDPEAVKYFENGNVNLKEAMDSIISELHDAKEYGSILNVTPVDFDALNHRITECENDISFHKDAVKNEIAPLIHVAQALSQKYQVVVTNPPYMGGSGMSAKLSDFVKKNYPDSKSDLFAVFIEKCSQMVRQNYFQAMITQHAWMFLSSFEKLRTKILNKTIVNMAHLGARAFEEIGGEVVQTTSFVLSNCCIENYKGVFCRLIEPNTQQEKEDLFLSGDAQYKAAQENFSKIPGSPVAYWASQALIKSFEGKKIKDYGFAGIGMRTGDNARFLRFWNEIDRDKMLVGCQSAREQIKSQKKWIPYNKGGEFRKWYGNNSYVVNWQNDGQEIKENTKKTYPQLGDNLGWKISNESYYYKKGITWSGVTSGAFSCRCYEEGFIFDSGANGLFAYDESDRYYLAGFLNSSVGDYIIKMINPTINTGSGTLNQLPLLVSKDYKDQVISIVKNNIALSKLDWDSFENSWDFQRHPLIRSTTTIKEAFSQWQQECDERFNQLKSNEEELNRIFIDIYGLQDELTPEEEEKDVTVRKADLERDIRSFVSYAVGCMFGRYSLDVDGLAYAGGDWDDAKYKTFMPDKDTILPITDDEYFTDDIVGRFVEFVRTVYGADTLEENLKFIADALDEKGSTSREVIRNYFLNSFYKDHLKTYQKRPIYWLFDSGKKNGFKCLIYMHRYQPDTIARIRTDYVHEQQSRYRTAI
ncbi:MAG: BREX-1 system adenine-specific DNA-methyltransferase PglX, partial [Lachnospiraceae bacterium]|nr:BREX-1 system adenine-specific DNA-methyltransferase PglX [Lachnospiraceae bacterium]